MISSENRFFDTFDINDINGIDNNRIDNNRIDNINKKSIDIVLNGIKLINKNLIICKKLEQYFLAKINTDCTNDENNHKFSLQEYKLFFEECMRSYHYKKFDKLIKISRNPEKLKQLFLNNADEIKFLFDREADISNDYDITKKENINKIISISRCEFLNLVMESYPNDEAIIKQVLLDLPRTDIFLNGMKINTIDDIFIGACQSNTSIIVDLSETEKKQKTTSFLMLILLLICQSSFFVSFIHLHNKVEKMKNTLNMTDPMNNINLADFRERNRIDIYITSKTLSCTFGASYRIFDVTDNKTIFKIHTETLFDVMSDTALIIYQCI
jgi:hypothetical protein